MEKAFKEVGYEVPQIIYWNLGHHAASIPSSNRKGITYLNGFSPAMLKDLMGESEVVESGDAKQDEEQETSEKKLEDAVDAMKAAVSKKSYDGLVVMD